MKFKTWEKVYWAIISVLITINLITIIIHEGDMPIKIQGEDKLVSKGTYAGYLLLGFAIIFIPIWLIVRAIVNSGDDKRERERERER